LNSDPEVQALLDKHAIHDVLMTYCRGIDRMDRDALESAYWPDATDDHGSYSGPATGFIDFALERLATLDKTQHFIGNVLIEPSSPDTAFCESYFIAYHQSRTHFGGEEFIVGGRYLDHMAKRGDAWRILRRTVAYDYSRMAAATENGRYDDVPYAGRRHPEDPLYRLRAAAAP
jgi:hypothetical protein